MKRFWNCHFRSWDIELRNSKIAFLFSQKPWKIESRNFQRCQISRLECASGFVDVVCHFRSRPEVIKEIKNFKFNLLNWNLYHIIRFLIKCPKQFIPPEVEASTSGYYEKKFQILNFQCLKSPLLLKSYIEINIYCRH